MNPEEFKHIAIVILAAGASSRMGRPKQLLKWKQTTFLNHAIKTAEGLNPGRICVILGSEADQIRSSIESKQLVVLINNNWKSGLGSSISCAIKYLLKDQPDIQAALIMLADQPLIDSAHLAEIAGSFTQDKHQIVATYYNEKKSGVPALFDRYYFERLLRLEDDYGARDLINKKAVNLISVKNPGKTADVDTPDDYDEIRSNHQ